MARAPYNARQLRISFEDEQAGGMAVIIGRTKWDDEEQMATWICGFRAGLRSLRGGDASAGLDEGRPEFQEYMDKG